MTGWEKLMRTYNPEAKSYGADQVKGRPRRWSLHALASLLGREPIGLLKEMGESGLVLGYRCPDVGGAAIFYLKELRNVPGMIDTPDSKIFNLPGPINDVLAKYPFPEVQGFRRFSRAGQGAGMPTPFDPLDKGDAIYEAICKEALLELAKEAA